MVQLLIEPSKPNERPACTVMSLGFASVPCLTNSPAKQTSSRPGFASSTPKHVGPRDRWCDRSFSSSSRSGLDLWFHRDTIHLFPTSQHRRTWHLYWIS